MERELNKDYIVLAVEQNGRLFMCEEDIIAQHQDLLELLRYMLNDKTKNLEDMESVFQSILPEKKHYTYAYPHSYTCRRAWDLSRYPGDYPGTRYPSKSKSGYYEECEEYLLAKSYNDSLQDAMEHHDVKMYSVDKVGWSEFESDITDDIKVVVNTNFCYGSSSYFLVKLTYKGVDIVPYRHLVEYYYANAFEIKECTRDYYVSRECWKNAIQFVVDAANTAEEPQSFIKKYIVEECSVMVEKLRRASTNHKVFFEGLLKAHHSDNILRSLRDSDDWAKELYLIYPDEMPLAFYCEKVSGALHFLDNLNKLGTSIPEINPMVNELKAMNRNLIPIINQQVFRIEMEVKDDEKKKLVIDNEMEDANKAIEFHMKKIEEHIETEIEIADNNDSDQKESEYAIKSRVAGEYEKTHDEYRLLKKQKNELESKSRKLKQKIDQRNSFIKTLVSCRELIEDKLELKTA